MNVVWQKNSQNNEWFDFLRLDLDSSYFNGKKGVYVLWYVAPPKAKAIKVGSGNLLEQLKNLRSNPLVLQYSNNGTLKVSWVTVNGALKEDQMAGVEAFLYDSYSPLMGERNSAASIEINLIGKA